MSITTVFTNHRLQSVRLPADLRLPDGVKKVQIRARAKDRIISPVGHTWDEFFLSSPLKVLPRTAKASQQHSAIRSELEKSGRSMGVNALHIAAHARSEGLTLVTNNRGELERVPGLLLENWVAAPA